MNAKITDFMSQTKNDNGTPFPDYDITPEDYVTMDDVLNQKISICEAKFFENDKGPGMFVLFLTQSNKYKYIVTHSVGIVNTLVQDGIQNYLAADTCMIDARIVKRKSTKTGRTYYALDE